MDELMKNLWLLLTIVIPGMTTYGTLRLLIVLDACRIDTKTFDQMDDSALVSACIVIAIAMIQQTIAMTLEAGIASICTILKDRKKEYYLLFCGRFKMAASGELNQNATRILGNCFASLNVTIGQCMILFYLMWYENKTFAKSDATRIIGFFILTGTISTLLRLCNAKSIIAEVAKRSQ